MSQMYNTKKFVDIYDTVTTFTTDYSNINLGGITDQTLLNKLYYLLYAKFGNSPISNLDETQWKYKLFSVIFQYGPNWQKELNIQDVLRELDPNELIDEGQVKDIVNHEGANTQTVKNTGTVDTTNNDEAITNHALNPNTNPSTNAYEPLNYINEQQASKNNSNNKVTNNLNADVKATDTSADTVTKTMTAGKLRGYEKLLSLLNSDITEKFLSKFGPLFQKVINLNPFLYESEE